MSQATRVEHDADVPHSLADVVVPDTDSVDVWDYFAANVDEYAVARAIVDHFDALPQALSEVDVDAHGLYLRAKVTLVRNRIKFADEQRASEEAARAIELAKLKSKTLGSKIKAACSFCGELRQAIAAQPAYALLIGLFVAYLAR